jgi:SpoIID/LytB domain protein
MTSFRTVSSGRPGFSCAVAIVFVLNALLLSFSPASAAEQPLAIKVAQYDRSFEFLCAQEGSWELGGRKGSLPAQTKAKVSGVLSTKAVLRFHVIVAEAPIAQIDQFNDLIAPWKAGGWELQTLHEGRILENPDHSLKHDGRIVLASIGVFAGKPAAEEMIRELQARDLPARIHQEVVSLPQGTLTLSINGQVQASGPELVLLPTSLIRLFKVEYAVGYPWHGFADRDYRGRLVCRFGIYNAIDCILQAPMEEVLAGIVPSEISYKAEIGALQAQAVAARGEILAKIGIRHAAEGFDTCSEQHCQVYSGENAYTADIARKIAPTAGQVLLKADGHLLDAVYAANCGGHGEANHLVWSSLPNPILIGVWDTDKPPALDLSEEEQVGVFIRSSPACYCNNPAVEGGDKFRWQKTFAPADWKKVEAELGIGRIKQVKNLARGFSGRIYQMTFVGERGEQTVKKELTIRKLLGSLRSSCFIADWRKDAGGFITGADLLGAGFGHGVGMCQTGAQSMAKKGIGFSRILSHYYPGSTLKKWY